MSFRQVICSPTVTPPIAPGQLLHLAVMASPTIMSDGVIDPAQDMVILDNNAKYQGIYTGGLSDCMAVTIVERDAKENINGLLMIHFPGGYNNRCIDGLMNVLRDRKLAAGGYRECIVTIGNVYADINQFARTWGDELDPHSAETSDIDKFLSQKKYESLAFKGKCKYIHVPGSSGSSCVTFDGYAGPFYGSDISRVSDDKRDLMVTKPTLSCEREEFKKIKQFFRDSPEIKKIETEIEAAGCSTSKRAKLYFYTREFIFNTQFKQFKPGEQKSQVNAAMDIFKEKIAKLPLSTKKSNFAAGLASLTGIGFFIALPMLFSKRNTREAAFDALVHDLSVLSPPPDSKLTN